MNGVFSGADRTIPYALLGFRCELRGGLILSGLERTGEDWTREDRERRRTRTSQTEIEADV